MDCVNVLEKEVIKSLTHPSKWAGVWCIKKTRATGRSRTEVSQEVPVESGVATRRVIPIQAQDGPENLYHPRDVNRLWAECEVRAHARPLRA